MFLSLRTATLGLILAATAIVTITVSAYASDPFAGTWELSLEKSTFKGGKEIVILPVELSTSPDSV